MARPAGPARHTGRPAMISSVPGKTFRVLQEKHSVCSETDIPCVRRKTFLVFEERHSVCLKRKIPCGPRKTFPVFQI